MNFIELVILGLVQGLTEFLPISSSGHLVVIKQMIAADTLPTGEPIIEVALHLGTLVAILLYYRKDVWAAVAFFLRRRAPRDDAHDTGRLLRWIVIGSIPTFFLGYFFKDWFEACFENPFLVGAALCVTGGLCLLTRFIPRGEVNAEQLGWRRSLVTGFAQGLAIVPGISRSGSTIVTGMLLGVKPDQAGRFSFLLSVPAVSGAAVFKLIDSPIGLQGVSLLALAAGIVVSALVGLLCLGILTRILRAGSFFYFGFYCIPLGVLVMVYFV